jgi:hypothetical protein
LIAIVFCHLVFDVHELFCEGSGQLEVMEYPECSQILAKFAGGVIGYTRIHDNRTIIEI